MEEHGLFVAGADVDRVDLGIDVAVCYEEVEPGVVVHIEEGGAPANVRIAGLADAGGPAYVVKTFRAHVAIEGVGLLLEVRDEKT